MNTLDIIVLIILILSALGFILWLFTGGSKPKTKIKPKKINKNSYLIGIVKNTILIALLSLLFIL